MVYFQATAEANNLSAVADSKDMYTQLMEDVCGGTKPYLSEDLLEQEHKKFKDKALNQFENKKKMGGEQFSAKYKEQLEKVNFFSRDLCLNMNTVVSFLGYRRHIPAIQGTQ